MIVEVQAISIEGGDTLNRLGGAMASDPHIVGYQCGGTIREVGDKVTDRSVGQRVVATMAHGSHAELVSAPAASTWVVPDGLDLIDAAAVGKAARRRGEIVGHVVDAVVESVLVEALELLVA